MSDSPQPPRPTQAQIDAAYRAGLFTCRLESAYAIKSLGKVGWMDVGELAEIPAEQTWWTAWGAKTPEPTNPDAVARLDRYVFPWGRVPVAEWDGWPSVGFQSVASLSCDLRPIKKRYGRMQLDEIERWEKVCSPAKRIYPSYRGEAGVASRLFDAGIWTCERAIFHPDEAPHAKAAWADPRLYAVYADYMEGERFCPDTARALRRISELTAVVTT